MKEKIWKYKKECCILLAALIVLIIITLTIGKDVITIAQDPKEFQSWIEEFGILGQAVMVCLVFLQIVIAWLPGELFEIGAGYAFGFWEGSFLVLLGSMLASALVMFVVKRYGQRIVFHFFDREKVMSLPIFHDEKKLDRFIFIAFFIPGTPKDILTYAVGLTDMKISRFLILTSIARIPSVITSTFTGSALGVANTQLAILSFVFTVMISAIGLIIYQKWNTRRCAA